METHLSAYITIRKKFRKDLDEVPQTLSNDDINVNNENNEKNVNGKIRMENGLLKQEINELKAKCEHIEIEKEKVEQKNETLERNLVAVENKLETEYRETRRMKDALENIRRDNNKMNEDLYEKNVDIKKCKEAVAKLNVANEKLETKQKQSEEDYLMLENVVANKSKKVSELETLVDTLSVNKPCEKCDDSPGTRDCLNEHDDKTHQDESVPSTSKCGSCDFESDDEEDLHVHVKSKHNFSCEICELTFQYEKKLRTHMCRLTVTNPTCGDYYTKNWILVNGCTRIFSSSERREVLFFHSNLCLENKNSCPDRIR